MTAAAEALARHAAGSVGRCRGCGGETSGAPWHDDCLDLQEAEDKRRQTASAYDLRLRLADVPSHFSGARLEDMDRSTPVEAARRFGAGEIQGLCLFGSYGVGKSYLAAAATWARLRVERMTWISVAELERDLRRSYGEEEQILAQRRAAVPGGVVLDDLDKISRSETGKRLIFDLVDDRISDGDPLIVTTNLGPSQLAERFDEAGRAVISRLAGHCELVEMAGADRRLERARAA